MQVTPPNEAQQDSAPSEPGAKPQEGGAQQAIEQIQTGYKALGEMIKAAGGQLDPQDIKLFQNAVQSADDFFQAMASPAQEQQQAPAPKQAPSQPMPDMANKGAQPAPQY